VTGTMVDLCFVFVLVLLALIAVRDARGLSAEPPTTRCSSSIARCTSRSAFLRALTSNGFGAALVTCITPAVTGGPLPALADNDVIKPKLYNISDEKLKNIITADIAERSFLVSADLTREAYDEKSLFTDEIDSYPIDKWIKGTKKLFVAEKSRVDLVGDVKVSPEKVEFRFDEDLMFRIPFRPVVSLSGRVVLDRDPETGLITAYREFWDQDVGTVLRSAKF